MMTPTTTVATTLSVTCPACDGEGRFDVTEEQRHRSFRRLGETCGCEECHGTGEIELDLATENDTLADYRGNPRVEAALIAVGLVAWSSDEAGTTYAVTAEDAAQDEQNGAAITWFGPRPASQRPGVRKSAPPPAAHAVAV